MHQSLGQNNTSTRGECTDSVRNVTLQMDLKNVNVNSIIRLYINEIALKFT